jgi:hypothetical protein
MLNNMATRFPQVGDKMRGARAFCQAVTGRVQEIGIATIARQSIRKAIRSIASQDEVLLFEASEDRASDDLTNQLLQLTREHLVEASILNAGDPKTLRYLMRCANRLTKSEASGFILQDEESRPVHFLWINKYAGFHLSEIDHTLAPCSPGAAMIFDCWTPAGDRGRGYYASAIRQAAAKLLRENKAAWIFSGANNVSSLRGIRKAGFAYRFSLVRRSHFGRAIITRHGSTAAVDDAVTSAPWRSSRIA